VLVVVEQVGLVLRIAPGVVWLFFTGAARPLFLERRFAGVCYCVGASLRITGRYLCTALGFVVLAILVLVLGALAPGVGLFFAAPVVFFASLFMYHHFIGVNGVPLAPGLADPLQPSGGGGGGYQSVA
jgi:uncharacterized membrane protein